MQLFEIADVSLFEGTIADRNYGFFFTSPRNRTQEADGSIPFISTTSLDFFFWKVGLKRFAVRSFQTQEASRPPSSTFKTRRCCAPATASGFT